jgi:DNA gyrase/topoisomerase IV subunit A
MKISDFYNTDYADYASYDNLRKIASAIDGQKNTARKIVCTVMDKNINTELKVSQLSNKMAEHTEYLHGDASGGTEFCWDK